MGSCLDLEAAKAGKKKRAAEAGDVRSHNLKVA